jgi:hypothetical protein
MDSKFVEALQELGSCLSAVDVPSQVVDTFSRLSQLQVKLFTTVFEDEAPHLQPTDLLLECLTASKAKDWPQFIVLVQNTPLELCLPEGLEE